jgi:hypothetical protein
MDLKKIFYLFVFFVIAGGIFYLAEHLNPKNGVTLEELTQLVSGVGEKTQVEIEKGLENMQKENILDEDKFSKLTLLGTSFKGSAKELYNNIILNNFKIDNTKFIELSSSLSFESIEGLYEILLESNIDKNAIIKGISTVQKSGNLNELQKKNLSKLLAKII